MRCVELFDHHCKWLNNCIGAKNYFEFYLLLLLLLALLAFCVAVNVVSILEVAAWDAGEWEMGGEQAKVLGLGGVVLGIGGVPMVWVMYLVVLHSYLILTKKSTIQLII